MYGILLMQDIENHRNQWLEMRRGKVGSSEIGTIAGLNRFKSPLELWAEWTGKVERDQGDERGFLEYGRACEPLVRKQTARRIGASLYAPNALYAHPDLRWATASPDSFQGAPGLEPDGAWEHKTTTGRGAVFWADGAPEMPITQLNWQQGVIGIAAGGVSCMIAGDPSEVVVYRHYFDPDAFEACVTLAEEFLRHVEADIPPDPGPGDAALIRRIVARAESSKKQFVGEDALLAEHLIAELRSLRAEKSKLDKSVKALDEEAKKIQNMLVLMLGGAEEGHLPDGRVYKAKIISISERMNPAFEWTRLDLPK